MPLCFALPIACLVLAPPAYLSQRVAPIDSATEIHGINPVLLDRKTSPTEDFYRFSNGSWLDQTPIPHDESIVSALSQARMRNAELMWRIVAPTTVDHSADRGTPEQLVGEFFRTGMDTELAERQGIQPIVRELQVISGLQTKGDIVSELGRLHRLSIPAGFSTQVGFDYTDSKHRILCLWQGGLSLRCKNPYLQKSAKAVILRNDLLRCIEGTFRLLGDDPESAAKGAQRVVAIESRLAQARVSESETGSIEDNFHLVKLAQLVKDVPAVDWVRYFHGLGADNPSVVDVSQPAFLRAFGSLVAHVPVRDWQTYLRWHFVLAASPYLSSAFVQQVFKLEAALTGQEQSRSRRELVLEESDASLGNELDKLLARTEYGLGSKKKVQSMVQNVRSALRETIVGLNWMAPSTKAVALNKLDHMAVSICYPDHMHDSSALEIKHDSYLSNVFRAREFEFQRKLDGISNPADRADWDVHAYAADAHYNISLNAIVLPAGVLQPPFFDLEADDASNYGALGAVIGHEMMHAFDGRGRKFDANGNLKNWWTEADGLNYDRRQKAFVEQYDAYPVQDSQRVDGKQTLEENVADLGGILVAYSAFKHASSSVVLPSQYGFTPDQRFFISFGQLLRAKYKPETERLLLESDPHSPPRFRVKGVLQNVPQFWKAFNADPPKFQLQIW